MSFKKFVAGYTSGLLTIVVELIFFGGSILANALGGFFPEPASRLSLMLTDIATVGLFIDVISAFAAAFNIGDMRAGVFGFLAGILTVILLFGGLLSKYAPQILDSLWGEFFAVLLPIIMAILLSLTVQAYRESQEQTGGW